MTEKTVRAQLNRFFSDVYKVLDPLSDPLTLHEDSSQYAWKEEWKSLKKLGFAPDCNFTRYKFSFFLFGRDDNPKKNYKPDRSVKNILETFCNRFPVHEQAARSKKPTSQKHVSTYFAAIFRPSAALFLLYYIIYTNCNNCNVQHCSHFSH